MGRKSLGASAMTAAERKRKSRELKKKEIGVDEMKKSERVIKQDQRKKCKENPAAYNMYLEKDRIRKQISHKQKTLKVKTGFSHKSSLARSVKRVKSHLPPSPSKRREVVEMLANQEDLNTSKSSVMGRPSILSSIEQNCTAVLNFLERSDISHVLPGQNHQVYIGKEDGKKIYKQKRYLMWTLRELVGIAQDDEKLSFIKMSTLQRFIKGHKEFCYQKDIPRNTCLCPMCENIEILCEAVNKCESSISIQTKAYEIVERFSCNPMTKECADGHCENCPDPVSALEEIQYLENVAYFKWKKAKGRSYPEKVLCNMTGNDCHIHLCEAIKTLKCHYYIKRAQSAKYKESIENLEHGEAIIHVDYSMNYKNVNQNEVKAAFFGQTQFSLFTSCCYFRSGEEDDPKIICKNFVLITPENDHSGVVTFHLCNFLLTKVAEVIGTPLEKVSFWSDGCGSQFRSQFVFYLMTKYPQTIKLDWHYFQANHGKGAVDGLGGTVKSRVLQKVKANKVVIESPKDFAHFADGIIGKISVIYVELDFSQYGEESRINAVSVPKTLHVHFVDRQALVNNTQLLRFFDESSPMTRNLLNEKMYDVNVETASCSSEIAKDISINCLNYVIINYHGEMHPGQITSTVVGEDFVKVNVMQKSTKYWIWPEKIDESYYYRSEIVKTIETPVIITSRGTGFYRVKELEGA